MKTWETRARVTKEGTLTINVPADIPPGDHHIVVVVEDIPPGGAAQKAVARPPLNLPIIDVGSWPADLPLRREDIYGDDGR